MFYSQFILAKKGPLGTIWIAAHLERKLRKNQVADTDIGVSVDSILFPDAPIALRLSSHLLLGVVRIYSRKVNYLFDDCSEALLKVKQAFRATAVDLPPEESKAPYHSITLPETFDLDDFELPDSDIFQGNFVDHHISSRDQITLQDNMEGVVYSTSQFGLDERFGDGDTSGLDLDEELLMGKVDAAGYSSVSADPQPSFHSMTPVKLDEHDEGLGLNADNQMGDDIEDVGLMDYAQAPSTPGLVEVPNLSNGQETSCCDDVIESEENHLAEFTVKDMESASLRLSQHQDTEHVVDCSAPKSDAAPCNGYHSSDVGNEKDFCPKTVDTAKHVSSEDGVAVSGHPMAGEDRVDHDKVLLDKSSTAPDGLDRKELKSDNVKANGTNVQDVGVSLENHEPMGAISEGASEHASKLTNSTQDVHDGDSEGPSFLQDAQSTDLQITPSLKKPETVPGEFMTLRPCNTDPSISDVTHTGTGNLISIEQCDVGVSQLNTSEKVDGCQSMVVQGEISNSAGDFEPMLMEKQTLEPASLQDASTGPAKLNDNRNNVTQSDSTGTECPVPEKMLSVPEGIDEELRNFLMESTPVDLAHVDESDTGSRIVSGKKRSYTESTLTEQSLNSVESSRAVRVKKSVEAIPDDDDLLSSILAGRKSSAFKVKPTPPPGEITSLKRHRSAPRASTFKRKVLMDDTMVLHGDTIRQQLMNTEDIRRLRKKAPCTRTEIATIQRLSAEDQIFGEPTLLGVSVYLASLHKQTYDLSGISIFKDELNDIVTVSASESMLTSRRDETAENTVTEHPAGSSEPTISELETVRENAETRCEVPREHDGKLDGASGPTEDLGVALDPSNLQVDPSQDVAGNEVGQSSSISEAINPTLQSEVGLSHCVSSDFGEIPQDAVQSVLLNRSEMDDLMLTDEPLISCDGKEESARPEVEAPVMPEGIGKVDDNDGQLHMGDFIASDEIGNSARDEIPQEPSQAAIAVEFDRETQDQVNYNDGNSLETRVDVESTRVDHHDQIFDGISGEPIVTLSGPDGNFTSQDPFLHEVEDFMTTESVLGNMVDADASGVNLHDHEDPNYYANAHDTDFLNFDDDEVDEVTDDYVPVAQEVRLTENTGWSSRTRAVAKYLQTTFVKEAECGRKAIPMDKLLGGKTRKEASRMFFEALVLKTRDYIQVEQPYPFDNIVLRPKGKLVKSDF